MERAQNEQEVFLEQTAYTKAVEGRLSVFLLEDSVYRCVVFAQCWIYGCGFGSRRTLQVA